MIFNSESNSYSELLISNSVKSIGRNRGIVRHVGGARMIHLPWPESSWSVFGNSIEFLYFHEIPSAWGSSPAAILSILFMYYGSMYHNLAFLSVLSVLSGQYGASCNFEPPAGRWGPRTPHAEMPQLLWWGWQCKCGWTIINPAFSVLQLINSQFCWC